METERFQGESFTATADVDAGTLYVTLSQQASKRWGAHKSPGVESDDCGAFRRALRRHLSERFDGEILQVEIYAVRGSREWLVDVLEHGL